MALEPLRILLDLTEVLRPGLTAPSFGNFIVVFAGWIRTAGVHAVTEALVVTGVAGRRHHEAYHRFFSRGTWDPDDLGRLLFTKILEHCAGSAIRVVVDDTLAPKKGPMVFGLGCHIDAVRSTRLHKVFTFGHVWVTVAVLLPVPFSSRTWALPILFRLYRNEKECAKRGHAHQKKTELARELLGVFHGWVGARRVEIAADCAYCCDTVTRGLPATFVFFGAMRPDAVLTAQPERTIRRGRPSKRGKLLPKPEKVEEPAHPLADLLGLPLRPGDAGPLQDLLRAVVPRLWFTLAPHRDHRVHQRCDPLPRLLLHRPHAHGGADPRRVRAKMGHRDLLP